MTEQDMKNLEAMFQRYVGTFYEDFQSKLDLVVEGHSTLDKKIDRKFDELSEKVDHNSFLIDTLNNKIDGVAADLKATDDRLSEKIDGVEAKLTEKIDGVATDLKVTDERLIKKIDGVEEKLNKKVDSVEQTLSQKIDGVAADLKAHRADTEAHQGMYQVRE